MAEGQASLAPSTFGGGEYSPDECSPCEYSPQRPSLFGGGEYSPNECSLDECSPYEYSPSEPSLFGGGEYSPNECSLDECSPCEYSPQRALTFWRWGVLPRRVLPLRVLPPANPHFLEVGSNPPTSAPSTSTPQRTSSFCNEL